VATELPVWAMADRAEFGQAVGIGKPTEGEVGQGAAFGQGWVESGMAGVARPLVMAFGCATMRQGAGFGGGPTGWTARPI